MAYSKYIAAFFAGALLANFVPHFVHGISGNKFPTPFSNPRGIGLSSSTINVIWALFNLVVGYWLFTIAPIDSLHLNYLVTFFAGVSIFSILMSIRFTSKHKE